MIEIIYRYDPKQATAPTAPATPSAARERLCAGNREFTELVQLAKADGPARRILSFDPEDLGVAETGTAPRQQPFALVLGCSDARVPTEMVFSQYCNDLFVVRVAGNVLGSECLGSIDYAVQHLGQSLKLLVVLGHTQCGAVTAAVDAYLEPTHYLLVASSHPLRAIVDRLFVSVRAAAQALERARGHGVSRLPGYRRALIAMAIALNAALTAKTLRQEFRDVAPEQLQVVFSVYHLASGEVNLPVQGGQPETSGLYDPPASEEEFGRLGVRLAGCAPVSRLLESA